MAYNMNKENSGGRGGIHYAWIICLVCALMQFCSIGLLMNTFQVFHPGLMAAFDLSNTELSLLIELRSIFNVASLFLVVKYYRRVGYKLGFLMALLLAASAMLVLYFARNYIMLCLAYSMMGSAYALSSAVPASSMVALWFEERRGFALGMMSAGSGVASVVMSPLFSRLLENHSLGFCFMLQAAIFVSAGILASVLLDTPENKKLCPYGMKKEGGGERLVRKDGTELPKRLMHKVMAAAFLMGAFQSVAYAYFMSLHTEEGIARDNVALGLSLFGLALIAGKFSFGYLSDRLGTSRANTLVYFCVFIGLVMSYFVHQNLALLYISMLLFGFGSCMGNVGLPVWASDFSRAAFYPETYNLIQKSFMIGNLVFNPAVGPAADLLGTYRPIYLTFAALSLVSYILIQSVYSNVHKGNKQPL